MNRFSFNNLRNRLVFRFFLVAMAPALILEYLHFTEIEPFWFFPVLVGFALLASLVGYLFASKITTPLNGLTKSIRSMAAGDLSPDIISEKGGDELGLLVDALESMRLSFLERLDVAEKSMYSVDGIPAPVMMVDRDFNITYINPACANMIRITPSQALGRKCYDIFRTPHCRTPECTCAKAMDEDMSVSGKTLIEPSGLKIPIKMVASPLKDDEGNIVGAQEYLMDIKDAQKSMGQILEGTNILASSISQISATASQLAASTSETSTSVKEILTTLEEFRQTAHVSNEKADYVAESADHATKTSEEGRNATKDTVLGMNLIRDEMESIAESIIKLSEQTQSIGEIINAVNDLADQSNLLSVNASIEAAKAGDHGKGFAVVAQEVKSLADQSKEATNQVRTILNDIQKATSTAVMATERGTKAVEKGVVLSTQSGESISTLIDSIKKSANAAGQIAASSQQQLIGIDQLFQAMESIKDASMQNLDGARQLEGATKDLEGLGQQLKDLAGNSSIRGER